MNDELSEKIKAVLVPCGAKRIALFGSAARGEARADSDVDILVRFAEPVGLLMLAHLRRTLAEQLGRTVDLVTEGALSPYIRPYVEREQVVIYEG